MTILAVDDNRDVLESVRDVLLFEGHVVWAATSADDAFARLMAADSLPDAVLLDLRMPGMSAQTFTALVKRSPVWSSIRIVLVTAANDDEVPPELEVDAVLHKPFPIEKLLDVLASIASSPRSG